MTAHISAHMQDQRVRGVISPFSVQDFEDWTRVTVPSMNNAIEAGKKDVEEFVSALRPWFRHMRMNLLPIFYRQDCNVARKLIQLIGFNISSIERHYQAQGCEPGTGLGRLPGIEDVLGRLSRIAHHPPRDSHYTYWLWNDGNNPLTFTGESQEVFFHYAVTQTDQLHSETCRLLRPICRGEQPLSSPESVTSLRMAEHNMLNLWQIFRSFMAKSETTNQKNMEPWFFMTRMRTYLPAYPVNGVEWGGVNAANLASQMQADYLIGTVNDEYAAIVKDRVRYLTKEDKQALEADMSLPSIAQMLLVDMNITARDVEVCSNQELACHVTNQPVIVREAFAAYAGLIKAVSHLTAIHWALIQNYLVKPSGQLTEGERQQLAVKPDAGTGGKTHEETKAIMEMRRRHPIIGKLITCI